MKVSRKSLIRQRKVIQQKLDLVSREPMPPSGWLKAVRGALGISIRQLAERVGVSHGSISQIEKRESQRKVTLESLEQIANAMECKLVYAIVPKNPNETLDDLIQRKANEAAERILEQVSRSMKLESQGTSPKQVQLEIARIAQELIATGDSRIWEVLPKKVSKT